MGLHFSTLLVVASVVVFICISVWFCVFIYQDAQEQCERPPPSLPLLHDRQLGCAAVL